MRRLLWLDDERNPLESNWLVFSPIQQPFEVIWVKSYGEFVEWITNNGLPTAICFDHDLADNYKLRGNLPIEDWYDLDNKEEYTGMDCARWLVNYCMDTNTRLPYYNIQSANPVGKDNISSLLKNYLKNVQNIDTKVG